MRQIHQHPTGIDCAITPRLGLLQGRHDPACPGLILFARRQGFFGQRDLARMDGPFALEAQHGGAPRGRLIPQRIAKIGEGPVDGAQSIGSAGIGNPSQGEVPLVIPVPDTLAMRIGIRDMKFNRIKPSIAQLEDI
jgi:hypothetical protein